MRGQVPDRDLRPTVVDEALVSALLTRGDDPPEPPAIVAAVVQRRPVAGQRLAELVDPVVVEEELHAPGQGVPRLAPLDVDGKRRTGGRRSRCPTTPAR